MKKDLDKKPSKGLPPTPEVPVSDTTCDLFSALALLLLLLVVFKLTAHWLLQMGACFSKVFNGCPLHINASASWIEPDSRDQIIFIGSDEGIYALNLNEMHEGILELVSIII